MTSHYCTNCKKPLVKAKEDLVIKLGQEFWTGNLHVCECGTSIIAITGLEPILIQKKEHDYEF